MDTNHISAELGRLGILPTALEDGLRRAVHHFEGQEPSPEEMTRWCAEQPQAAAHLFTRTPETPPAGQPSGCS